MTIRQGVNYGNAEVRGQVRAWKAKLARDYAIFHTASKGLLDGKADLLKDMIRGSRSTRRSAFDTINKRFGPGVKLEKVGLANRGDNSVALWSILKSRDAVTAVFAENTSEKERASLAQDCVTVDYILVGTSQGRVANGLWSLEIPDHALGRAVERSRLLHPETIIRDAHQNLLDLPDEIVSQRGFTDSNVKAYIKAGAGCFIGYLRIARDVSVNDDWCAVVRVDTWLDEDQLHDDQIVLSEKGEAGKRLGDSWLMPRPLRIIEETGPNVLKL